MSHVIHNPEPTRSRAARPKSRLIRAIELLPVLALIGTVLVPSPPAVAQATRTFVSGVGNDADPCSRTAPCRTFSGALIKTAAGGEINTLDPGGFGGLTINKSITISGCTTGMGGVLVAGAGVHGITINAAVTDKVTLRCLDINGTGTAANGVRVLAAQRVKIIDSEIYNFARNAVDIESSTNGLRVIILRSIIRDNTGVGVVVAPTVTNALTKATVRNSDIVDNGCGVVATAFGMDPAFTFATECGTRSAASGINGIAVVNNFENLIAENATVGVFARGTQAINRISENFIVQNGTGLRIVDSGNIPSWGDNKIGGNGFNGSPTGPVIPPAAP